MTVMGFEGKLVQASITHTDIQRMLDCLMQWQNAAWAGDAYEYCNASNERDRILDGLLGEGTSPSKSDNTPNGDNQQIGDN